MLSPKSGKAAFWLMFVGFNVAFLPMHFTGLRGMPRRVFTYPEGFGWDWLNLVSTVGAFVFAAGVAVIVVDVLRVVFGPPSRKRDPWNAGTLEWILPRPQRPWQTRSVPPVSSRYPLWDDPDLARKADEARFYLPDAEEGKRETLITNALDGEPVQCLRLPGNSFKPMLAAIFIGGSFILTTFHFYWSSLASGAIGVGVILWWLWTGTALIPEKSVKDVGLGLKLPLYVSGPDSVGWWAMLITMLGDMSAFFSLAFGYFFFWTIHTDFPPPGTDGPGVFWPGMATAALLAAWALMLAGRKLNAMGSAAGLRLALVVNAVLSVLGAAALLYAPHVAGLDPTLHSYPAIVWVLVLWTAVHIALGALMTLYCLTRSFAGLLTREYDIDIQNVVLYWHFAAITAGVTFAVISLFPLAKGG
jgi:cytochrome c oxidase subunit I+III